MLIIIEVSLLNQKKLGLVSLFVLWKKKKINKERKIKENKKIKINNPLSGSFAKVWTELRIPDLTKNVPHILNVNVEMDNMMTQEVKTIFFSKTRTQCKSVVKASQGINETFSTGSQNQTPPKPYS